MKRVNQFHSDDPTKLTRELSDFEDNVDAALQQQAAATVPRPIVDSFQPIGSVTVTPLLPDHQLSIDTATGNAIAVLPAVASANFGRRFVLVKRSALNQITVTCSDPSATHNAAAFPFVTAAGFAGVRVFYCDARGYYS
jgi:hypothetical protein